MRAIDGDELLGIERLLDTDVVRQSKTASWLLDQVLHDIQAMPTLTPPNEWLRVEERLPENNAEVLMWRKKWKIAEAGTYRNACFWVYDAIGDSYKADDITYWMPLPAPPDCRPHGEVRLEALKDD